MKAAIITIGTEILIGSILNSNSKFLSERLSEFGIHVSYHVSVRDDHDELLDQLKIMNEKVDIIFLCGGLGPTADDITKQVLAEFLNKNLVLDDYQYNKLKKRFEANKRIMTENNLNQVYVIESSNILDNNWGIAPGEYIEQGNKKYFLLPGPPKEFEPMVDTYLKDILKNNNKIIIKSLNIAGLGESRVEDEIRKLKLEEPNISINTFAKFYDTEVKIIAEGEDFSYLNKKVKSIIDILYATFTNNLYAEDNVNLSKTLINKLLEKNLTISFAESMTGGLMTSMITKEAGASNVIKNSIIAYSNIAKIKMLGVNKDTINQYGAVSEQTAYEMAKGLKNINLSDINVSITGEAGPVKSEKDIGTVYVCYYYNDDNYEIKEYFFRGNRNEIQQRTADSIMLHLIFNL
ncbi:competence damage-inducible protein A [Peptoniphilus sp. ING2-D1G]|nr:competence damage-inducible protein A [Peptoniphilus sp. ING2-D1G]